MVGERFVPIVVTAFVVSSGLSAQQAGSMRGTVFDKDFDSPLAGAEVTIVETGQKVQTNDQGAFTFSQVRPGKYTIVVARDGYVRQVRADLVVTAGQMTEVSVSLAGEFTDMEEFVVSEPLRLSVEGETALLDVRLESPAFVNAISSDTMSKAGASDAAKALRLVSGASLQNGKTAVIRGLPDRYVSSQMNGVRLPSADEDKRAVELDQFPSEVISSILVSKTFTPDQHGDASGGAVDVRLKGVPDQPLFVKFGIQSSHNTQVTGRGDFLTYKGGGLHYFGDSASSRAPQPVGESWDGAVGVTEAEAPLDYKWSGAAGGRFEVAKGVRVGGFASFFYDRDTTFYDNGREDSWHADTLGEPLVPDISLGTYAQGDFITSLLDVKRGVQSTQWGGLGTVGVETDDHAIALVYLTTHSSDDTATLAEDTRGKQYFYPGYDPDNPTTPGHQGGANYLRYQTLDYTERLTTTLQLAGRHRLPMSKKSAAEIDWTIARSTALRDQPDKRLFATTWTPSIYAPLKPASSFTLGNLQRTYKKTEEESDQYAAGLKLPFSQWSNDKGYVKVGVFSDKVDRTYVQETFSNFEDNQIFFPGEFDELDWSANWMFEDHPITASDADVSYFGTQDISATYGMIDLPLLASLNLIGGVRWESTDITVINDPDPLATWLPPGGFAEEALLPGAADVDFSQNDVLPSIGLVHRPFAGVTLRAAYNETVARQTFKELTPILNQEYIGGPVFVGNPELAMSNVRNYDLRADYVPTEGTFLSASWFRKDIENPIEYIERATTFNYTTVTNYPRGRMNGVELEARQAIGPALDTLEGLTVGGNVTFIDASVRLPDEEIRQFEQQHGVRPATSRDMTNAPEFLYNLFLTYDIAPTRTQLGVFYTVQGDTLVQGSGPSTSLYVPPTYLTEFDTLNVTLSQRLGDHIVVTLAAKNLTDPELQEVYRSEYIENDVLRRSRTEGIEYSLTIGGEYRF